MEAVAGVRKSVDDVGLMLWGSPHFLWGVYSRLSLVLVGLGALRSSLLRGAVVVLVVHSMVTSSVRVWFGIGVCVVVAVGRRW